MIESIIPMTAGLLLDICGTLLIVKLFLSYSKNSIFRTDQDGTKRRFFLTSYENESAEHDRQTQGVIDAKFGFGFLSIGFFLIIIASWISYCETHSCLKF